MSLLHLAQQSPEAFAKMVRELRSLGVVRITETSLELGEAPRAPVESEGKAEPRSKAERDRDILFAATRFRPSLPDAPRQDANIPHVVMRRERAGARHGGQGSEG